MAFTTPDQSPEEQYALAGCLAALATVMVALRFYAVKARKDQLSHDDWWILVALVGAWAIAIVNIVSAAIGGLGRHTELDENGVPVMNRRYIVFLKTIYANQLVQLIAVGPTKLSVLLFYRRIFVGKAFGVVTWILMVLVAIWTVAFFFTNLLECIPVDRAWAHVVGGYPDPKCMDAVAMYLAQAYIDVILDFIILVIPIPLVWKLQMPLRRRLAVMSIFLVGVMTIGASLAKLVIQMFIGTEIQQEMDISYFLTPIMYWPMIEAALGITAACLPRMRSLFETDTGINKLYRNARSSITSIVSSARRSTKSSQASWSTRESMDLEMGHRGQSLTLCNSPRPARIDLRAAKYDRPSMYQPRDAVVVEREFSTLVTTTRSSSDDA